MPETNSYHKSKDILSISENAKKTNTIPMVIHRLLLYDKEFPNNTVPYLREFRIHNKEFCHVLWRENDVLAIMNEHEKSIYNSYEKKIQKSDYGRYIVLKYFGGIYLDFDIKMLKPFISLYDNYKYNDLFFEENTLKEVSIQRNETPCKLRIANYIMMHKPHSKHIQGILDICDKRHLLPVFEEQDVIYTTGPDVLSAYVEENKDHVDYIKKNEYSQYLIHLHHGHWRYRMQDRK